MLYRKITSYIVDYLKSVNDKILILEGARQIGKAFSIRSLLNLKCKNTKSEEIIEEIKKQSKDTILKYLKKRCADSKSYVVYQKGLEPLMPEWDTYLLAEFREVVIVAIAPGVLNFSGDDVRESPLWKLAMTCNMMENRLGRLCMKYKHTPRVWGMLLTESTIANQSEMAETWDKLHVSVIDGLSGLQGLSFRMKDPEDLPLYIPPVAFACSSRFSEDNVKDAVNKLNRLGI